MGKFRRYRGSQQREWSVQLYDDGRQTQFNLNLYTVSTKINWPTYSEGGQNMVWQTQGSMIEDDVRPTPATIMTADTKWRADLPEGWDAIHD